MEMKKPKPAGLPPDTKFVLVDFTPLVLKDQKPDRANAVLCEVVWLTDKRVSVKTPEGKRAIVDVDRVFEADEDPQP